MSPQGGCYLFLGSDRPRKLQRIAALERSLGIQPFDRHQLDGSGTTSADLLALCRQQPALSPVRLIVVDHAHRLDGAGVEALLKHATAIAQTACLILLVEQELSVRHALAKLEASVGTKARPSDHVIVIERFSGGEGASAKPFALTDALGKQDVPAALAALHEQLCFGKEPLELLGLIAWQLQRWVLVRRLLDEGYSADRLASVTGMRLWQAQRAESDVTHRPLASLHRLLARCWELDVETKSGRAIPELAIEQLVFEVCLAAG